MLTAEVRRALSTNSQSRAAGDLKETLAPEHRHAGASVAPGGRLRRGRRCVAVACRRNWAGRVRRPHVLRSRLRAARWRLWLLGGVLLLLLLLLLEALLQVAVVLLLLGVADDGRVPILLGHLRDATLDTVTVHFKVHSRVHSSAFQS